MWLVPHCCDCFSGSLNARLFSTGPPTRSMEGVGEGARLKKCSPEFGCLPMAEHAPQSMGWLMQVLHLSAPLIALLLPRSQRCWGEGCGEYCLDVGAGSGCLAPGRFRHWVGELQRSGAAAFLKGSHGIPTCHSTLVENHCHGER